ncbi:MULTISPECIES: hypothetical protein [unclassified Micromonospora]
MVEFEIDHVVEIEQASAPRWQVRACSRFNPPAPTDASLEGSSAVSD